MADKPSLLIVDDDPLIADTLAYALGKDFDVMTSDSRKNAVSLVRRQQTPPQLALVDLGLPPLPHRPDEGFALIAELLAHSPEMKILVLSGQNDAANARHARTLGATDFVGKPCEAEGLKKLLLHALQIRAAEISGGAELDGEQLIGASPVLEKLKSQISQYADSPFPALIEGESGSGKEVVARSLHRLSWRRDKPWFALNCAAIAPTLVEPTLFGYSKGAFTGATANKSGYFEDAQEGTLFLDEIGELPLELQAKLLRVLENGEFQRVGETQQRTSHARVIAATNRDLRQEIKAGRFRADLYHRLSVFSINVPPLREMGEDKTQLLAHFTRFYAEQAKLAPFTLDQDAIELWRGYRFPGNVRELKNIVIRLTTKYPGQKLSALELEPELEPAAQAEAPALAEAQAGPPGDPQTLIEQAQRHLQRERHFNLDDMLKAWEQGYIEAAMRLTHGNVSQAAKMLGINRTTLYSRMEQQDREIGGAMYLNHFGLDEPPFRITPHTDFFFAGANRGATLEALLYAITHDEGIVKVSGEVGSGKTMLCRVLAERLPAHVDTILLANPSLGREEMLYAIVDELDMDVGDERQPLLLRMLSNHLIKLYGEGRRVVVLIDEAHAMPPETLEQIRLLSNLETSHSKLLQIVLFGQPELDAHLSMPDMRPLKERITHSFRLEPLLRSDVEAYLDFRMRAAGYRGPNVFTPEAVRRIVRASEGLTRRVNILADKSLLAAFADNQHGITARHVERAIRDSEYHRPTVSKAKIAAAAGYVAAGLALGLGAHYLLSPSAQPPALASPVSLAAPANAATAPAATDAAAAPARDRPTQPIVAAPPASVAAASPAPPATPAASGVVPEAPKYVPPPTGKLTLTRFAATQEWLKTAPGGEYSIQLFTAGVRDLHVVEGLLAETATNNLAPSDFYVYGVKIDDRQHYRLAYGLYRTFAEANQGMRSLPPAYRQFSPYLRSVERMRSQNSQ